MKKFNPKEVYSDTPNYDEVVSVLDGIDLTSTLFGSTKKVIYLSGPIMTGSVYESLIRSGLHDKAAREEARVINASALKTVYGLSRKITPHESFINPSGEVVKTYWFSTDYMFFWTSLIIKRVKEVRVLDGWEHSNGCVAEVICALTNDIRVTEVVGGAAITNKTFLQRIDPVKQSLCSSCHEDLVKRGHKLTTLIDLYQSLIEEG